MKVSWPGERLLERMWKSLVDNGVGGLLEPIQIRRIGRAQADVRRHELLLLAQAERDAAEIRAGRLTVTHRWGKLVLLPSVQQDGPAVLRRPDAPRALPSGEDTPSSVAEPDLHDYASTGKGWLMLSDRMVADEIRREVNVANAILHAEDALRDDPQEPPVAEISVDWLLRWRENAAAVSTKELQHMWGRVLAGEVKAPGAISLRTMEFLRNVSQDEAIKIERLACFVVGDLVFRSSQADLDAFGMSYTFLLEMQELGILTGLGTKISRSWKSDVDDFFRIGAIIRDRVLLIEGPDPSKQVEVPCYKVTAVGRDVLKLVDANVNAEYLLSLARHIKTQGFDVTLAKTARADGLGVYYSDEVEV